MKELFGRQIFPHGYPAMDFFFILSDFVLTFAYRHRLDGDYSTFSFFKLGIARLYPLYLLGLLQGGLCKTQLRLGTTTLSRQGALLMFTLGLFLVPVPLAFAGADKFIFPFNLLTWSSSGRSLQISSTPRCYGGEAGGFCS